MPSAREGGTPSTRNYASGKSRCDVQRLRLRHFLAGDAEFLEPAGGGQDAGFKRGDGLVVIFVGYLERPADVYEMRREHADAPIQFLRRSR